MNTDVYDRFVSTSPGCIDSYPPKDGLFVAAWLHSKLLNPDTVVYIFWDETWGNGAWFDSKNHAVAEKNIWCWEKRVPETAHYPEVLRLNTLKMGDNNTKG